MDSSIQDDSPRGKHPGHDSSNSNPSDIFLQAALYFPDIVGKSLDKGVPAHTTHLCQGKISVLSMLSTKISEVSHMFAPPQIPVS